MPLLIRPLCATLDAAAALLWAMPAAAVTTSALPYGTSANNSATNSPEWTVIVFGGTSMSTFGGVSTLDTANGQGDLYDRTRYAGISFAPTNCNGNQTACDGVVPNAGIHVAHAANGSPASYAETLVPINLSQAHRFEWLLKNGQVSCRIDGQVVYSGATWAVVPGTAWINSGGFLLIGDGSATTHPGTGQMFISGVSVDTAPLANTLISQVPEPATLGLWAAGLLALGGLQRSRRWRVTLAASGISPG